MSISADIKFSEVNKSTFYSLSTSCFFVVRGLLYPNSVVRTRQQVSTQRIKLLPTLVDLWREGGIRSLYRGFGTQAVCQVPSHIVYLTMLEGTRELLGTPIVYPKSPFLTSVHEFLRPYRFLFSGALAATCSQFFFVPLDVVIQRMQTNDMLVKQYPGMASSLNSSSSTSSSSSSSSSSKPKSLTSAWSIAQSVWRADGLRGFYSGFIPSILTYAPSSAIWWATFSFVAPFVDRILPGTRHPLLAFPSSSSSTSSTSPAAMSAATSAASSAPINSSAVSDSHSTASTAEAGPKASKSTSDESDPLWTRVRVALDLPKLPSPWTLRDDVAFPMTCGLLAGCTAVVATNGIDVVKTRLQVLGREAAAASNSDSARKDAAANQKRPNMFRVAASMWRAEGWKAFTRGMSARLVHQLPQSALLSTSYHFFKRASVKPVESK